MAKRISDSAEAALSVIAHVAMAREMARNVEGMSGFYEFYVKRMPAKDLAVLAFFDDLRRSAWQDLCKLIKEDDQVPINERCNALRLLHPTHS